MDDIDQLINDLEYERVGRGRGKLEAPMMGVGSAFGRQPSWAQMKERIRMGLITPTSVLMSSVSLPTTPAGGALGDPSTGSYIPQGTGVVRENGFVVQSPFFEVCPNCTSTDISSNRARGFSRCEKCYYTVDPTNRPSRKEMEMMGRDKQGELYVGTKPLPQLLQTTVSHNARILAGGGAQTEMMYELFHACQSNNIKKITEILDRGIDVNCVDFDTGSTPLHWACAKSQQHAIRLLVERGANINAQNKRGVTPLHSLILNRIEPLAFWLIRKGADIMLTDNEGQTPADLALPWTQQEMKEIFAEVKAGKVVQTNDPAPRVIPAEKRPETLPVKPEPVSVVEREVMKIFLKNEAYKSLVVTSDTTAKQICDQMAEKLNLGKDFGKNFDVTERVKRGEQYMERRLDGNANIFDLKSKWPLIFGDSGNETSLHCRFIVNVKRGCSGSIQEKFREAIYGGATN